MMNTDLKQTQAIAKMILASDGHIFGQCVRKMIFEKGCSHNDKIDCIFDSHEAALGFIRHVKFDYSIKMIPHRCHRQYSQRTTNLVKFRVTAPSSGLISEKTYHRNKNTYVTIHQKTEFNTADLIIEWSHLRFIHVPFIFFDINHVVLTPTNTIECSSHIMGEGREDAPSVLHLMERCAQKRFCLVNGCSLKSGDAFLRCYRSANELVRSGWTFDRYWAHSTLSNRDGLPMNHTILRRPRKKEKIRCPITLEDVDYRSNVVLIELECKHLFDFAAFSSYVESEVKAASTSDENGPNCLRCPLCKKTVLASLL